MANLVILSPAAKYLKKLKDKQLKKLYRDAIDEICADPSVGVAKHGDLEGVLGYDIYYNKINYELAYTVEEKVIEGTDETETIVVIMAGTRENFYDQLKRYWT
ncbi:MAG: type II toxin-antitoxin system RelE/ParE family toxin [Lachnospiraceae bacterium]|nr:type II toxin-antitoxin system RelE/ParE family toxin [Lachnospiraceae bacterium]